MAIHSGQMETTARQARKKKDRTPVDVKGKTKTREELVAEHLPPLALVLVILLCSGALLVFSFRDFFTTGKNIAGSWDEAMLVSSLLKSTWDRTPNYNFPSNLFLLPALHQINRLVYRCQRVEVNAGWL